MKKRLLAAVLLLLVCLMAAACESPHPLGEVLIDEFLGKEQYHPLSAMNPEGADIPCREEERTSYLSFPSRNTASISFTAEEDTDYWGMTVRNQGYTDLTVDADGISIKVAPGTVRWIYTTEKAEPGEHMLNFTAQSGGALMGSMELWLADSLEKVTPTFELTVKITSVRDDHCEAELWQKTDNPGIPQKFSFTLPETAETFREGDIVAVVFQGAFTGIAEDTLENVLEVTWIGNPKAGDKTK